MAPVQEPIHDEIASVLAQYDLGKLVQFEQNLIGYNNTNFAIKTEKQGVRKDYFFRRYKSEILPEEIIFEHALIRRLLDEDICQVARVHKTKTGETFFTQQPQDGKSPPVYYAVFDYLQGEDRFTWIDPQLNPQEVLEAAMVLAKFHDAVYGFVPPGRRVEPQMLDLLPQIMENLNLVNRKSKGSIFDDLLQANLEFLLNECQEMQDYCAGLDWSLAPRMVIHCDYHPGNLKFSGSEVVGLFDFDWSKIDLRCFDVGLAIWYLCHWGGERNGIIRFAESLHFLQVYQEWSAELPTINPLDKFELQHLPVMVNLGNLFVLNWTVRDYYATDADPEEYLMYLEHSIQFSRWFSLRGWEFMRDNLIPNLNMDYDHAM